MKQYLGSLFILAICSLLAPGLSAQGVAINAGGGPPDPSAILDVTSSSQGTLFPRMTAAQRDAIVNPATGLFIFNLDCMSLNFNSGTPSDPVWSVVTSSGGMTASVGVSVSPSGPICGGGTLTFTANPTNGGASPSYQWKVNGANVGTNSDTYSTASLLDNDEVVCVLTSSEVCVTGPPVASDPVFADISYAPPASPGAINGPISAFRNSTGNGYSVAGSLGASSYTWSVPSGATITAGQGTPAITVTFGPDAMIGTISVTANNECGSSTAETITVSIGTVVFNANGTGRNGSIQTFTVETTGTYTIEAFGAQGGSSEAFTGQSGGLGARVKGDFELTAGAVLQILVGQQAEVATGSSGGGGGSFVVLSNGTPLIIAGGGGGLGAAGDGLPGLAGTAGGSGEGGSQGTGGDNGGGGGGAAGYGGGGGGGLCGNGGEVSMSYGAGGAGGNGCADGGTVNISICSETKGLSFQNGGTGGSAACYYGNDQGGDGGYGGGGAALYANHCGAGGGGYSGGGGGGNDGSGGGYHGPGGGGGSYNSGTNQSNSSGVQTGNGQVIISF